MVRKICGTKCLRSSTKLGSDGCKKVKLKTHSEEITLKASNSLFMRLLIIAKLSRELDLEEVIGNYEFSDINNMLMKADGSLHPCLDKSKLIHILEDLAPDTTAPLHSQQLTVHSDGNECILFDGVAIVNELSAQKANIHSCKELAEYFVRMIELKSSRYREAYIIYDDCSVENLQKDYTRQLCTAGKAKNRSYKVDDNTCIQDYSTFLSSKDTKLQLTLYLAQKVIENCSISLTTHTKKKICSVRRHNTFSTYYISEKPL